MCLPLRGALYIFHACMYVYVCMYVLYESVWNEIKNKKATCATLPVTL